MKSFDFLFILYTIMRKRVVENVVNICYPFYAKSHICLVFLLMNFPYYQLSKSDIINRHNVKVINKVLKILKLMFEMEYGNKIDKK